MTDKDSNGDGNPPEPPEGRETEQIRIMKRMVELAERQTELSEKRTRLAEYRSRLSEGRSRKSEYRSRLSEDRSRMSEERSRMSEERSRKSEYRSLLSEERSELSSERSYMNTERTLSNWTRTGLALMVFGIAVDRFSLLLSHTPGAPIEVHELSTFFGAALIAFGVAMVIASGIRFLAFGLEYRRKHRPPKYHGPYLAASFALLVALFGLALLVTLFIL